jgi:hypothetical protein
VNEGFSKSLVFRFSKQNDSTQKSRAQLQNSGGAVLGVEAGQP